MGPSDVGQDPQEKLDAIRRLTGSTTVNSNASYSPTLNFDAPYSPTLNIDASNSPTLSQGEKHTVDVVHPIDDGPASGTNCDLRKAVSDFGQLLRNGRGWLAERCPSIPRRTKKVMAPPIIRSLGEKNSGYPDLATFTNSSESYMLFRKFGYLYARALFEKQDELRRLEERLEEFDEDEENFNQLTTRSVSEEEFEPRKVLFGQIETTLAKYSKLLLAAQQIMSFNRPSETEYSSVCIYLENQKPVEPLEQAYVRHKDDLVTLRPGREHAWLDRMIEFALRGLYRPFPFIKHMFSDEITRLKTRGEYEVYFSRNRINLCANFFITIMILVLLVVPTYLLYHEVSSNNGYDSYATAVCIGILLVFTLAFSAVLSLFTRAKRHEILGAAAAYCAVLVVFLGNVPGGNK